MSGQADVLAMGTRVMIDGGRCADYDNEPGVYYHAHDLPRCREQGIAWWKDRYICQRHLDRRVALASVDSESSS